MSTEIEPHDGAAARKQEPCGGGSAERLSEHLATDGKLKAEDRALRPASAIKILADACREREWEILRILKIDAIKHRPGSRMTIRYEVEARRRGERPRRMPLYAKLYRGRKGERIVNSLDFLRSRARLPLRFPAPLGYSARWRLIVLEALAGPSLAQLLHEPEATWHLARFAESLADFHELLPARPQSAPGPGEIPGRRHDGRAEEEILEKAVSRLREAPFWKEIEATCEPTIQQVREQLKTGRGEDHVGTLHLIHRDLYPDQVLIAGGCVGLIDVDELSIGEREVDVGNFLAHLVLSDLQKSAQIEVAPYLSDIFLSSYRRGSLAMDRVGCYQASSLLRLASLERLSRAEMSVLPWTGLALRLVDAAARAVARPKGLPDPTGGT